MEKILQYLEELNLSDTEAKLYLELLKSGPIAVKDLAKAIGIKRTTAYFHIELLIEKGLIVKIVNGSHKQIAATKPEEGIKNLIEQKMESAKNAKTVFPTMLKEIQSKFPTGEGFEDAEVRYYKGKSGVRKIYEEILQAKEIRSYVNVEQIAEVFPDNFQLFNNAFKNNPDMTMFEIVEDSPQARTYIETASQKDKYFQKILPQGMKITAQDIVIYDNQVAIIHLKENTNGIVLRNTDLYNNFKLIFDFIWNILPE
jgi:sugar-specific transcriptional regulator TrmB